MELKEYLKIIKRNIKLFISTILLIVITIFTYFLSRPISYDTSLTLNITRIGSQQSQDYQYDNFYRIQADEKFAETIVEWLKSPRIASDIYQEAGISTKKYSLKQLGKFVKAEKRSSQVVFLNFSSPSEQSAQKLSEAMKKVLSKNTEDLNKNQKDDTWFSIVASEPVIIKKQYNYWIVSGAALLAGIFLGFWMVMGKHYVK